MASSLGLVTAGEPLCAMTSLKYLCEPLTSESNVTLAAPADSPQIVTLLGKLFGAKVVNYLYSLFIKTPQMVSFYDSGTVFTILKAKGLDLCPCPLAFRICTL